MVLQVNKKFQFNIFQPNKYLLESLLNLAATLHREHIKKHYSIEIKSTKNHVI